MRIEIDGKFAIDRAYEGLVLQRYAPPHPADRDSKFYKKGDIVPGKWVDDCYPWDLEHALKTVLQDAVMLSPETVTDLRAAIREFRRIEKAIQAACSSPTDEIGPRATTR